MNKKSVLVIGGNGQLGKAFQIILPEATFIDQDELDITNTKACEDWDWSKYQSVINAAAYTNVDGAETAEGRVTAWAANAVGVANLAKVAIKHDFILVHVSSDYVFDGSRQSHSEDEPFSPLGIYGQSKAAGDIAASLVAKHYLVRTSWVVGDGRNFIRTMAELASKGVKPSVVNDQIGRLTFTGELAKAIQFLLEHKAPFGTYNLTNTGESVSWATIAKTVYHLKGKDQADVTAISTKDYYQGKPNIAPRPKYSTLGLDKIESLGYKPEKWEDALMEYVETIK